MKGYSHLCSRRSELLVQSIGPEEQAQDVSIIDIAHIPCIPERNQATFRWLEPCASWVLRLSPHHFIRCPYFTVLTIQGWYVAKYPPKTSWCFTGFSHISFCCLCSKGKHFDGDAAKPSSPAEKQRHFLVRSTNNTSGIHTSSISWMALKHHCMQLSNCCVPTQKQMAAFICFKLCKAFSFVLLCISKNPNNFWCIFLIPHSLVQYWPHCHFHKVQLCSDIFYPSAVAIWENSSKFGETETALESCC